MEKKDLIGSWKLLEYKISWNDTQEDFHPFGQDALGYLLYNDQYVSVHIMRHNRPKSTSEDFRGTADHEKIEMVDNYGGYVGSYEIRPKVIIHYPEVSMYPNFTLTPQERQYQYLGHRLILECPYASKEHEGRQGRSVLVWERVNS